MENLIHLSGNNFGTLKEKLMQLEPGAKVVHWHINPRGKYIAIVELEKPKARKAKNEKSE